MAVFCSQWKAVLIFVAVHCWTTTILTLNLWYQFELDKLYLSVCARESTCWACGQSRWESYLAGYFSARLIPHAIENISKLAVRRKGAEISRSGEREDAILPLSVAALAYTRLAFIKLTSSLSRKWLAATRIL